METALVVKAEEWKRCPGGEGGGLETGNGALVVKAEDWKLETVPWW